MTKMSQTLNLPSPINISYWWNFGSMLGMFLIVQILSGFFISIHYCPNINLAFSQMIFIIQDIKYGWLLHNIHMNGASFFFLFLYLHLWRNLYYVSFKLTKTWLSGITIFIISMITAFLGYILPWGQMSFWGATVITNLVSSIPYIGNSITQWIWGGFAINNATLNRFFSLHFIMPFLIILLIFIHLFFLHESGSKNPLGTNSNIHKIPFNFYFTIKDIYFSNFIMMMFIFMITLYPYLLSESQNFTPANPLLTPPHIQPEWYFLFAYSILRSIPNKLGGVIALMMSIMIFYFIPLFNKTMPMNSSQFYFFNQIIFWFFINNFLILTLLGIMPIEYPYILINQLFSFLYFNFFFMYLFMFKIWTQFIF